MPQAGGLRRNLQNTAARNGPKHAHGNQQETKCACRPPKSIKNGGKPADNQKN